MDSRRIETKKGTSVRVLEAGDGEPVVFLHSAAGLLAENAFLEQLAARYHVYAPELPGYGESLGEDYLEDMLDFTLHAWDVVDELGLADHHPHVIGHSMGGMIAAEMACVSPHQVGKLVLAGAAGLWLEEDPIPDIFSFLPFEFADYLFHDPAKAAMLSGGTDFSSEDAMTEFLVGNSRRLGMAGKILFPVPNRRVSKRLYRLTAPTLIVWGESDKLMPLSYAAKWNELIPGSQLTTISEAGHMLPYEQPEQFVDAVGAFLG
jgi:pimeloyl-ACP methyl ester carboxylesterase